MIISERTNIYIINKIFLFDVQNIFLYKKYKNINSMKHVMIIHEIIDSSLYLLEIIFHQIYYYTSTLYNNFLYDKNVP